MKSLAGGHPELVVVTALTDTEQSAHCPNGKIRGVLFLGDESVFHFDPFAKDTAAFIRIHFRQKWFKRDFAHGVFFTGRRSVR
jgi:hypothetical protein